VHPLLETRLPDLGPWPEGTRVALACSGGADSTFLALAWQAWAQGKNLPSRVLVVDHGHRAESEADAASAQDLYRGMGYQAEVLAPKVGGDTENELRIARYEILARACREGGETVLLMAHHADDLAETVLLRVFRGTGLKGLAGIPTRRTLAGGLEIRRPLLCLRREKIRENLVERQQDWIEDQTNANPEISARNRLRLLMPQLSELGTADPVVAVLRLSEEAAEWEETVLSLLAEASVWSELPPWLRKRKVADELRVLGATVSPTRLRDIEFSLLEKGSAAVDRDTLLTVSGGTLHSRPRA